MKGLSEKIEKTNNSATTAKLRIAFKSHFMTVIEPTYVGEIDRTMKKRISEHSKLLGSLLTKKYGIALSMFFTMITILDWETARITATEHEFRKPL